MPPSSPPRPPLPALGLPRAPRRLGPAAVAALAAHVLLIGALIWDRARYLEGALGGDGPQGGGGGGGERLSYVALPPAAESRQAEAPKPQVTEAPIPVPQAEPVTEPEPVDVTPVPVTPATVEGTQQGTGGGTGQESGSGGGSGTATGTGTGSNDGPGSGGDGGYIQPAVLRGLIIAPDCARGQFTVLFAVAADGRVSGVDVQPPPKDSGCRREFVTRMRQYKFYPAKTTDGRAVASTFAIKVEH